jgi:hypothetical protein
LSRVMATNTRAHFCNTEICAILGRPAPGFPAAPRR